MRWLEDMPAFWAAALGVAIVAAGAAALSAAFRAARAPGGGGGAALLGGAFAGLILGAGVLGAAAPRVFDPVFRGGVDERTALEELGRAHAREMAGLRASGVTGVALEELAREHAREREPLEGALAGAESAHGARFGAWTLALVSGAALLGWASKTGRPIVARPGGGRVGGGRVAGGVTGAMSWVFGAAPGAAVAWLLVGEAWVGAVAVGGAAGAGWVAPTLRARLEGVTARRVEVDVAQLVAFWLASVAALGCALMAGGVAALVATLCVWGVAAGLMLAGVRIASAARRAAWGILMGFALPAIAALAIVRIEPLGMFGDWRFWVADVLLVVCATDLRFAGAWVGARLRGVDDALGVAAAHVAGGGGIALAALGAALGAGGVIGARAVMLVVLAGAAVEVTTGAYALMGRVLRGAAHEKGAP